MEYLNQLNIGVFYCNSFYEREQVCDYFFYLLVSPILFLHTSKGNNKITELRTILQRESPNFDIYVTEYGTALTNILPILFLYLNTVTVTTGTFEP
jgi:hypothetical protein